MTILINISRNLTHHLLWVGREDNQQGPITLWRYALKAFWCLEQANEDDLPGACRYSWISDFIDTLSKAMPLSAHRLAHVLHLFSDEKLSMYQYEDFLRILFYAAAPIFIVCVFSEFEDIRDHGIEEGRARERLFASMGERLLHGYLFYKWVETPFYLIQTLAGKPASKWLLSIFDVWLESIISDGIFVIWMFFVWWTAESWMGF